MDWLRLAAVLLAAYASFCVILYLLQDRLIFFPRGLDFEPRGVHVEPAILHRGGLELRGWVVNAQSRGPLLIYFGGNGEEVSGLVDVFAALDATTVLMNYRGYGASGGTPSAADLVDDADALVETMRRRLGQDRRVVVFGRSLGSGIAALTTRSQSVDDVVLMSPYRSLEHLAKGRFPFMPVRWLLRHRIDATAALETLPERVLVLYAVRDEVVPTRESRAFVDLMKRRPQVVEFEGGHNVALTTPAIWQAIETFVVGESARLD